MKIIKFFEKIIGFFKSLFLNGLFTILPITATIFFAHFTYNLLSHWLIPLRKFIPIKLHQIPGIEFLLVTLLILTIGIIARIFIIAPIINYFEKLISKIPLIRTIYSAVKTLAQFFNVPNIRKTSKKVVLIQFPKKGFYNIAFQLESAKEDFQKLIPLPAKEKTNKNFYKVFMPNSPNPASGYFLILSEDEIIPTNMTFEEAIKTVVSCGIISPQSIRKL
ncbi:DUF502 domain-containing protein [Candidatus Dependentiae bacterium]|nr:DUF502 domain-containing protein [Candidatus Dependentiae bacterium]